MNRPRVLFHLSTPPGALPGTDAVVQEVEAIRRHLGGGRVLHLYPSEKPGTRIPRLVWGLQHLRRLAALEHDVDLHHVFNPDPFPFAVLSRLKRPIVYSAVAGLGTGPWYRVKRLGRQVACLTVPTEPDRLRLGDLGLDRTAVIPPGIDWYRFEPTPPPPEAPFVLLAGSAPWTTEQFESKGVNALLAAAQREPDLHLVFLWRGLLADEMRRRVAAAGLDKRAGSWITMSTWPKSWPNPTRRSFSRQGRCSSGTFHIRCSKPWPPVDPSSFRRPSPCPDS